MSRTKRKDNDINKSTLDYSYTRYFLNCISVNKDSIKIEPIINGIPINMQMDTGATISFIDKRFWEKLNIPLKSVKALITGYTGHEIPILGFCEVSVELDSTILKLNFFVTKNRDTPIFGLDWIRSFGISLSFPDRKSVKKLTISKIEKHIGELIKSKPNLFSDALGSVLNHKIELRLTNYAFLVNFRSRPFHFPLKVL